MSERLILLVVLFILLRGMTHHIDCYDAFVRGARKGLQSALGLLPVLLAMTLMIGMLQGSGLADLLSIALAPMCRWMHLPQSAMPVFLLRPLTGSGSLAALEQIYQTYGVDSRDARLASVLMGSSETVFYTMTIYLSSAKIRRLPRVIPISLLAGVIGAITAGFIVH